MSEEQRNVLIVRAVLRDHNYHHHHHHHHKHGIAILGQKTTRSPLRPLGTLWPLRLLSSTRTAPTVRSRTTGTTMTACSTAPGRMWASSPHALLIGTLSGSWGSTWTCERWSQSWASVTWTAAPTTSTLSWLDSSWPQFKSTIPTRGWRAQTRTPWFSSSEASDTCSLSSRSAKYTGSRTMSTHAASFPLSLGSQTFGNYWLHDTSTLGQPLRPISATLPYSTSWGFLPTHCCARWNPTR